MIAGGSQPGPAVRSPSAAGPDIASISKRNEASYSGQALYRSPFGSL